MQKDSTEHPQGHENHALHLTINEKKYDWPHQFITGAEVRQLAHIPQEDKLFLSIKKPWEDEPIQNETKTDLARPGIEHFFSKMALPITIIVNGREKSWNEKEISFEQVVKLAFDNYVDNGTTMYTVTYKRGQGEKPEGSMVKSDVVKVKDKMIFNVTATDKS